MMIFIIKMWGMQDESHSHSGNDEMEVESDNDDAPPAPLLPPGNMNMPPRPNLGPPFLQQGPQFGQPLLQHRPPRQPPLQFPGVPPLGGEEIFGGEGHKLGGKEVAVMGDAQLIHEEGGQFVQTFLIMHTLTTQHKQCI